jgi:hypothetical protein
VERKDRITKPNSQTYSLLKSKISASTALWHVICSFSDVLFNTMRTILSFIFIVFYTTIRAQTGDTVGIPHFPLTENKIVYAETIEAPSMTKDGLMYNGEEWYRRTLQSSDNRLTILNTPTGEISGPGTLHASWFRKKRFVRDIFFTIDIIATNGKYQYRIYNIYSFEKTVRFYYSDMYQEQLYPLDKTRWTEPYRRALLNNMNDKITALIIQLKNSMQVPYHR